MMTSGRLHPLVPPESMEGIVDLTPELLAFLFVFVTHLGSIAIILPALFVACFWDFERAGFWLVAVFVYRALMNVIKTTNGTTRPTVEPPIGPEAFPGALEGIYTEAIGYGTTSFPSGHAMVTAMLAALVIVDVETGTVRQRLLAAGSAAVLIGYSRVALGVHYPSDVLAGMFLGVALAWVVVSVRERITSGPVVTLALAVVLAGLSELVRNGVPL